MSEMTERVARAICKSVGLHPDAPARNHGALNDLPMWKTYERDARAAIAAMRDPTEKMIEVGTVGWDALDGSGVRPVFAPQRPYRAMIDEALREP